MWVYPSYVTYVSGFFIPSSLHLHSGPTPVKSYLCLVDFENLFAFLIQKLIALFNIGFSSLLVRSHLNLVASNLPAKHSIQNVANRITTILFVPFFNRNFSYISLCSFESYKGLKSLKRCNFLKYPCSYFEILTMAKLARKCMQALSVKI